MSIELKSYYSNPDAKRTLEEYCQMSLWNMQISISLSLGCNPKEIDWLQIAEASETSIFSTEYHRRLVLLHLSIENEEINFKRLDGTACSFAPVDFVEWAKQKRLPLPDKMEMLVKQYRISDDWKSKYVNLAEKHKTLIEKLSEYENKQNLDVSKKKKDGYDKVIAILGKIIFKEKLESFNSSNIWKLSGSHNFDFKVMSQETLCQYLKEARKLLGQEPTAQKKKKQ